MAAKRRCLCDVSSAPLTSCLGQEAVEVVEGGSAEGGGKGGEEGLTDKSADDVTG